MVLPRSRLRLAVLLCLLGLSMVAWVLREPLRTRLSPPPMPTGLSAGRPLPAVPAMRALDGTRVSLPDYRGRVVLVHFWTFACSNCEHMVPRYGEWLARYGARGLSVVGYHTPELLEERDEARLREYVRAQGIRWTVVPDGAYDAWSALGINAWPTMLLLDRAGMVRGVFVGDHVGPEVEQAIRALL